MTPNIDRIAEEGVRFTDGYVASPVCTPSRQALMTGRHPSRHGGHSNRLARDLPERLPSPTIANIVDDRGYTTHAVGKWDLAGFRGRWDEPDVTLPHKAGFDTFYGSLRGMENYCPGLGTVWEHTGDGDYDSFPNSAYMTEEYTANAEQFLVDQRDKADPYMLYLSYTAPHAPIQTPETCPGRDVNAPTYRTMIEILDDGIGRVLEALGDDADNTMVMFVSDHGSQFPQFVPTQLRGKKFGLFEGGIRAPLAMRWPAGLSDAPATYEPMVSTLDFLPTVAAVTGRGVSGYPGTNLIPYLTGKQAGAPHDRLHWRYVDDQPIPATQGRVSTAIRSGDYKYLRRTELNGDTTEYLFDLTTDIGEQDNLADDAEHADVRDRLVRELNAWNERNPLDEDFTYPRPANQPRDGKPDGFLEFGGAWNVVDVDGDNLYRADPPDSDSAGNRGRAMLAGSYYENVRFAGDIWLAADGEAGLILRGNNAPAAPYALTGYGVRLDSRSDRITVDRVVDGEPTAVHFVEAELTPGTQYRLRTLVVGRTIHVFLDGRPRLHWTDHDPLPGGNLGLTAAGATSHFDNLTAKRAE